MSRYNRNYGKKPPDIGLVMECHDEALTPEQQAAYNKAEKEYQEVTAKLEQMMKSMGGEIVEKSDNVLVMQVNSSPPPLVPTAGAVASTTTKNVVSTPVRQPASLAPTPIPGSIVQAIQPSPVILQGSPQPQGVLTRSSAGNSVQQVPNSSYQLVMDPRLGLIVGTVTTPQAVSGVPLIQTTSAAQMPVSTPPMQTRSTVNTRGGNVRIQPTPIAQKPPIQPAPTMNLMPATPATPTPTVPSLRIKTPKPPAKTPAAAASSKNSSNSVSRPTEGSAVGGLSTGPGSKPWQPIGIDAGNATVVDLTDDDGRATGGNAADSREVTFNKLSGKTFPSLVVVARPHLRLKDSSIQGTLNQERTALDSKVKSVLMFTPTKYTEWLIQQGLVRSEQYCTTHVMADNVTPIKLKLGMYSDVSKFPYSGGYVWISDCCPQRFVSVFSGSIFEGAPHPPTVLLKLIYHWACQTNVQNVVQWVKVDNFYVKNFFTNMRSVCTSAIHEKYGKMGGLRKRVEVGVISLGTTSQDGNMRQVKVEVLGVMDPENKLIRLRAVEPLQDGERNYKRRFVKILEPLEQWVDKDSIILTDFTVDKGTLHNMGFSSVYQVAVGEASVNQNKYSNQNVMEYLRRIVPRMFQNTLSMLSRQIIQQFLDELVWRERWGPVASQAFDNVIAHMAEQTKLETGDSLLFRLLKVAGNPFKLWNYAAWKTPPPTRTPVVTNGTAEPAPPPPVIHTGPISSIDMLPQSIRMVDTPATKRSRKRTMPQSEGSEPKRAAVNVQPVPTVPEEQISLDAYYYGSLEGDAEIIKEELKSTLTIKCCVCHRKFSNNISLMKHLIAHAQSENQFSSELSDLTQCKYCLKSFPTPFSMQTHIEEIHLKASTSLMCRICEEKFRDRPMLISHMHRTHIAVELPYECGICKFRSSLHRDLIDHFYEVHNGGEKLQCPFCLKIVAFATNGKKMSANINFFLNHIQKHQRKSIARRCNKCAMWFVHKGILKEHEIKDHSSFKGVPGVKPFVNPSGVDVMMPVPPVTPTLSRAGPLSQKKLKAPATTYATRKFEPSLAIYGVQNGATCCECEGDFLGEDHFVGYLTCSRCRFATCCSKAMTEHTVVFHESGKNFHFTLGRVVQLTTDMFCVCGYQTGSGNRLANHLARCERKSAYPSPASAKAATIQSASFPPLVTLDDAENAEEDPSDRWLKAFVPSRKEDTGEGSRDAPDKKQAPQSAEGGDPPSMLNILGLVRKPSTDESSLDRALSDSEGLPDSKTEPSQPSQEPEKSEKDSESEIKPEEEKAKTVEEDEKMEVEEAEPDNAEQPEEPTNDNEVDGTDDRTTPTNDNEADGTDDQTTPTNDNEADGIDDQTTPTNDNEADGTDDQTTPTNDNEVDDQATPMEVQDIEERTSPVETEENSQDAAVLTEEKPASPVRTPSPVVETEESKASQSCEENDENKDSEQVEESEPHEEDVEDINAQPNETEKIASPERESDVSVESAAPLVNETEAATPENSAVSVDDNVTVTEETSTDIPTDKVVEEPKVAEEEPSDL